MFASHIHNQDSYLRSKKMMKLAYDKELTTANSLVNDSKKEDEAVLFVIVTPQPRTKINCKTAKFAGK